ncbi:unnamed protein product [Schistocephalus solidus]|uniref:Uncharacterized protein n=1 Tax=Schistocephalus solidus TaxID=70667 RepID=A0A183TQY5_SCHSO|nr:unnamed protein product [Schistocephalus solidus]
MDNDEREFRNPTDSSNDVSVKGSRMRSVSTVNTTVKDDKLTMKDKSGIPSTIGLNTGLTIPLPIPVYSQKLYGGNDREIVNKAALHFTNTVAVAEPRPPREHQHHRRLTDDANFYSVLA